MAGSPARAAGVLPWQAPAPNSYTVFTPDGRRSLPYRSAGNTDLVALDQVASLFTFTTSEDAALNALTITARGQRINLIAGQSLAQVAGRVVQLSGPVQRDRGTWAVPVDFLSAALGPALGTRIEVRRTGRVILVGDARVPQVSVRFERAGSSGRLTIDVQPPTPQRVTREGARLIVRFEASALDTRGMTGLVPEFVASGRTEGAMLVFELGPSAVSHQTVASNDPSQVVIDLMQAAPPATTPTTPQEPPVIDIPQPGTIRTVVIDPGHGGEDEGARGPRGTREKDLTLQVAQKLKATIESRLGLRVLLTREGDDNVPYDRRTAIANNNKADVFFSLHANASLRPGVRGAQVLSLASGHYAGRLGDVTARGPAVPALGGGTRTIESGSLGPGPAAVRGTIDRARIDSRSPSLGTRRAAPSETGVADAASRARRRQHARAVDRDGIPHQRGGRTGARRRRRAVETDRRAPLHDRRGAARLVRSRRPDASTMNETLDQRGGAAVPPRQPAGPVWWSRRATWIAVAGGLALSLGVWLVLAKLPRLLTTPEGGAPVLSGPAATGETRKIHATLFYVADTGNELIPVNAEVPFGDSPAEQARRIVGGAGPAAGRRHALGDTCRHEGPRRLPDVTR